MCLASLTSLPELTMEHREDLTRIPLVTIDPHDAKDHDDAVWAEPDTDPANEGGAIAIVAIADVSFYVRLRNRARRRGNPARQFGLFPRPGRADAAGEAFERSLLAARWRAAPLPRRAHDLRPHRQEALAPLRARHDALGGQALLSGGAGGHRRQAERKDRGPARHGAQAAVAGLRPAQGRAREARAARPRPARAQNHPRRARARLARHRAGAA